MSAAVPLDEDEIRAALSAREITVLLPAIADALKPGDAVVLWMPASGLVRVRCEGPRVVRITLVEADELEAQLAGIADGSATGETCGRPQ